MDDDDCPPPPPVQPTSADDDEADLNDSRRLTAVADISSTAQCGFDLEVPPISDPDQSMLSISPGQIPVQKDEVLHKIEETASVSIEESFVVLDQSSTSTSAQNDSDAFISEPATSSPHDSQSLTQQAFGDDSTTNAFEDALLEASASLNGASSTSQPSNPPRLEPSVNAVEGEPETTDSENQNDTCLNEKPDMEEPERLVEEPPNAALSTNGNAEVSDSGVVPDEDAKETNNNDDDDDDDEFGDFEEFGDFAAVEPTTATNASDGGTTVNDDAGWAAFGDAPVASTHGGWAADFSSAGDWPPAKSDAPSASTAVTDQAVSINSTPVAVSCLAEKSLLPGLGSLVEDANLWDVGDDDVDDNDEIPESADSDVAADTNDLLRSFDCDKFVDSSDDTLKRAFDVWLALRIIEETIALKCQWNGSTTNSCFLKALSMDANLAKLRNTGLPVFAQQLGGSMLTPMAPGQQSVGDATPSTSNNGKVPSSSSSSSASCAIPVDSLSVPPAQFDWRNSGLTNPLTAASVNASSTIFDLDFLTANETGGKGGNIAAALQKDLDALGLNSPTHSAKGTDSAVKQPSLLDQLMSQSANKATKIVAVSELTVEAKALHDALPNLDYMHSSVLMFPIRRQDGSSK